MKSGEANTRRLKGKIWGDSMVGGVTSVSKKRRKRQASKIRRVIERNQIRSLECPRAERCLSSQGGVVHG